MGRGVVPGELFVMELPEVDGLGLDMGVDIGEPLPDTIIPAEPVAAFPVVSGEFGVLDLAVFVDGKEGVAGYFVTVGLEG